MNDDRRAVMRPDDAASPATMREAHEQLVLAIAQSADAAMDERHTRILAELAHELRTPLQALAAAAALLDRYGAGNEAVLLAGRVIQRQVQHMTRLAEDVVDGVRLRTGKLRLQCQRVEMQRAIKTAVEDCRPAIDAGRLTLGVHLPPNAIEVEADPMRLRQVITNLLGNAIKYTPALGTIEVLLSLNGDGRGMRMEIVDSGIGISAETLPNAFQPFVQDPRAAALAPTGLGLGLALVHDLVTAHGGDVVLHSAGRGLGTRVAVTLPLATQPT